MKRNHKQTTTKKNHLSLFWQQMHNLKTKMRRTQAKPIFSLSPSSFHLCDVYLWHTVKEAHMLCVIYFGLDFWFAAVPFSLCRFDPMVIYFLFCIQKIVIYIKVRLFHLIKSDQRQHCFHFMMKLFVSLNNFPINKNPTDSFKWKKKYIIGAICAYCLYISNVSFSLFRFVYVKTCAQKKNGFKQLAI